MNEKIASLEKELLEKKPWQLQGEVTAQKRPENSLLEETLHFDHAVRMGMWAPGAPADVRFHAFSMVLFHREIWNDISVPPTFYFKKLQTYKKVDKIVNKHIYAILLDSPIVNILPCLFSLPYVCGCLCVQFSSESFESNLPILWHFIPKYLHMYVLRNRTFSYTATILLIHPGITDMLIHA